MDAAALTSAIVREAARWVGLRETRANELWSPAQRGAAFRAGLESVGWRPGWAYCASFVRLVVRDAMRSVGADETLIREYLRLQGHGVVLSWRAFETRRLTTRTPTPGSVFYMRKGRTALGHAGIVTATLPAGVIETIEANTSPQPTTSAADRDGQGVYRRQRRLDFRETKGLWLLGFAHPAGLPTTPPGSTSDSIAA